jgi:hypothetical protein
VLDAKGECFIYLSSVELELLWIWNNGL